jgi:hypothetical protein
VAGLNLGVGGFGGVGSTASPQYGTANSYANVTQAAFGPGMSAPVTPPSQTLFPNDPFGIAVWVGIGAVALLVLIRHSLPR